MTKFIDPSELAGAIKVHLEDCDDVRIRPSKTTGISRGSMCAGNVELESFKWSTRDHNEVVVSCYVIYGPNPINGGRTQVIGSMTTHIQLYGHDIVQRLNSSDLLMTLCQVDNFVKMVVEQMNTPEPRFND